jgi:hypothetical protein
LALIHGSSIYTKEYESTFNVDATTIWEDVIGMNYVVPEIQ